VPKTKPRTKLIKYDDHPLADLFPLLGGDDLDALVADIRQHGQREPIILCDQKILDGRNRYLACAKVPVTPRFETYQGDNPLALVTSLNLRRRHLNESQRAMIAAKLSTMRQGERTDLKPSANLQKVAQADAAALLHISARTVASAAKVRNAGSPTLVEAVEQGRIAGQRGSENRPVRSRNPAHGDREGQGWERTRSDKGHCRRHPATPG
jgi:hypothetical protein